MDPVDLLITNPKSPLYVLPVSPSVFLDVFSVPNVIGWFLPLIHSYGLDLGQIIINFILSRYISF